MFSPPCLRTVPSAHTFHPTPTQTTLLKILGGKHMVAPGCVSILGRPPFHDTNLTVSGDLSYVGGTWTRDIAFAGCSVPLTVSACRVSYGRFNLSAMCPYRQCYIGYHCVPLSVSACIGS